MVIVMKKITLLLLAAPFFGSPVLFAQNEFHDATFGVNGLLAVSGSGNGESDFKTIVLQPDGKLLTAATFHDHGPNPRYVINRYTVNGAVDGTFGENGFIVSNLQNHIGDIKLQSNGKIVGFAIEGDYYSSFSYLMRYNTDGSLDGSFGINGKVIDTVNTITSFTTQLNDKIVVAKGSQYTGFSPNFNIVRYTPDGMLDMGFGTNGEIKIGFPNLEVKIVRMIVRPDGKIIAMGLTDQQDSDHRGMVILKLNDNGIFDSSFGEQGVKFFSFHDTDDLLDGMVHDDGKITFLSRGFHFSDSSTVYNQIVRIDSSGNLDVSFGLGGVKLVDYPILSLRSLQQLPGGKLIIGGTYETGENPTPINNQAPIGIDVSRYDEDGELDLTFGDNGHARSIIDFSRVHDCKLAIQADGKVLIGVGYCESWYSCHPASLVVRYDINTFLSNADELLTDAFLLYPNPVKEMITLDFNLQQSEVLFIDLYDSSGRLIFNLLKDQNFPAGTNSQKMYLPGALAGGVYFLAISNGMNTTTVKIVK